MQVDEAGNDRAIEPGRGTRPPVALIVALGLTIAVIATIAALTPRPHGNPFAGRVLYVDPGSSAARAAAGRTDAERHAGAVIAEQPTATWLTPESHPTASVAAAVERIVADAASADTLPVFVLYGINDRDCGGQTAGGLPSSAYLDWVTAVADGRERRHLQRRASCGTVVGRTGDRTGGERRPVMPDGRRGTSHERGKVIGRTTGPSRGDHRGRG